MRRLPKSRGVLTNVGLPFISSLSLVSWLSKYAGILRQLALSAVLSREESQVFLLRSNLMRKLTCMKARAFLWKAACG